MTTLSADLWPDVQPETARRLMLAGVESFAERGYHATTTRDIAGAAGMSPAALYVHFPSKAALLFAISRNGHEQTLALVEDVLGRVTGPMERMRLLVEDFVAWHARRHTVARVVQYELNALPEKEYQIVAQLRRKIEQRVREVIADGVESGAFTVGDVGIAARAVLSLGVDVARWYSERTRQTPAELGKEYGELVLRMLGAS
ncbi:TetR/AcrR family transcriptional regulator [Amycolatopsis rubida]|uniref:TetR/AcrR family transcriptional regulator n=1 Tax=Amycolatopsis rubida TaxID=112413 RepID=A0A1I5Q2E5_9PSEU|nr:MULTISPECIES: TetR/AcrR family transcriptional regulator [Amycolatopsis]MYW95544.1 TetR family transcriptional regulator [Amycolatopsis rubida]NEC60533.1 TetR/AcrR family transcriptional regulator [Amycolatopsis rubida]OAP26385.1 HTH-type transcriptional repressor KstR2 [Amycolatopsis sp. M39]SFP40141.1 transcriptional regulator, TetR family [Amycolatopsis rubida]